MKNRNETTQLKSNTVHDRNADPVKLVSGRRFLWVNRSSVCTAIERISVTAARDFCRGKFSWGRCHQHGNTAWWCPEPCREQHTASATCWLLTNLCRWPSPHLLRCPVHVTSKQSLYTTYDKQLGYQLSTIEASLAISDTFWTFFSVMKKSYLITLNKHDTNSYLIHFIM